MKSMSIKKVMAAIMVLAVVLCMTPAEARVAKAAEKTAAVGLNATKKNVYVGKTFTLKISGTTVTKWTTSDKKIATVKGTKNSATVKGIKAGKATIKATCKNGKTYKCTVTVKKKAAAKMETTKVDSPDKAFTFTITNTKIKADGVVNYESYASVALAGVGQDGDGPDFMFSKSNPKSAIIDRNGKTIVPYSDAGKYYYVSSIYHKVVGGKVYISDNGQNGWSGEVRTLDNKLAFSLEEKLDEYRKSKNMTVNGKKIDSDSKVRILYFGNKYNNKGYSYVYAYLGSVKNGQIPDPVYKSLIVGPNGEIYDFLPELADELRYISEPNTVGRADVLFGDEYITYNYIDENGRYNAVCIFDYKGNVVSDMTGKFARVGGVINGIAWAIGNEGEIGYIDIKGNWVIQPQFKSVWPFTDKYAKVLENNGKYSLIDTSGNVLYSSEQYIYQTDTELVAVDGGKGGCGLYDFNGNVALKCEYDDISDIVDNVCYAVKDGILYIINITKN
jgi:hypothetical protein